MSVDVTMPQLGETVAEGTVTRWLKSAGDRVGADEPLLEVSTDKVDTEVPAPAAGVLLEILVGEDSTVPVGAVLAVIGEPAAAGPAPSVPASPPAPSPPAVPAAGGSAPPRPSPLIRRLLAEAGLRPEDVVGTGPGGKISRDDIEQAAASRDAVPANDPAAAPAAAPAPVPPAGPGRDGDRVEPLSRLRQVIARRMTEALASTAQLTTVIEADVTALVGLRAASAAGFAQESGLRLTLLPFFARAALEALAIHPLLNASLTAQADAVCYHSCVHLGIAVDTDRGLMVPVIRDAADLSVRGLARRIADLAGRARAAQLGPDELAGATFTLTNTGSRGALFDTPILTPPQVGILGIGAVVRRVQVLEAGGQETLAVRSMVHLALTYDHRLVDGADAARFLTSVRDRLAAVGSV